MIMENHAKPTQEAFEMLAQLPLADKLGLLALLMDNWRLGLINEMNSLHPDELVEQERDVFFPLYAGIGNAGDLAAAFLALYREKAEPPAVLRQYPFPDLVEPAVAETAGMRLARAVFYRLSYSRKLDYLAELLAALAAGTLLDEETVQLLGLELDGYQCADQILSCKRDNGLAQPETDLPFDLA